MAPIRVRARAARPARSTATAAPAPSSFSASANVRDPYSTPHKQNKAATKSQKRESKHAVLLSRLNASRVTKKTKPRRPSKKLTTDLASLASALPAETLEDLARPEQADALKAVTRKVRHQSLKSRPGAAKKKEKLVGLERDRFAKNMALMQGSKDKDDGSAQSKSSFGARWAAIRSFIETNNESKKLS